MLPMALPHDGSKTQVIRSLSVAAFVIENTAESWGSIRQTVGLPEALRVVGKTLPLLPIFLKSLESTIKDSKETKETKEIRENYAAMYQFAELCQQHAKYLSTIFDAVTSTEGNHTAEEKYRTAAEKSGGTPIEVIMKMLLQQAISLATTLTTQQDLISSLYAAMDEVVKVKPSLGEEDKTGVVINNYGQGNQFYHAGSGNQNHCAGGSQYTGDGYVIHMTAE
ncbi:hypothetical protein GGI42DRAFT_311770 [Trichoderma sp. SZMC 28013]